MPNGFDGLDAMFWAYLTFALAVLVGFLFPNRRTAALVKLTFVTCLFVVLGVIIYYGGLMAFLYFGGGVSE